MVHGEIVPKRRAVIAAGVGSAALAAYSIAGAFQTLVWNPMAAVPGATLTKYTQPSTTPASPWALPG